MYSFFLLRSVPKGYNVQMSLCLTHPGFQPGLWDSCITVVKWDAYEPGNRAEVLMLKNFTALLPRSRLEKQKSREPSQLVLWYEHIRGKARSRKPGSHEDEFTYPYLLAHAYLFKLLTRDFIILWGAFHVVIRPWRKNFPFNSLWELITILQN